MTEGVLCISTGDRGELSRNSIGSLRSTNPELPCLVLADRPYDFPFRWVNSWTGKSSRRLKTSMFERTPFDTTLFVDDDTCFCGELPGLDELLKGLDIALASDLLPNLRGASVLTRWAHHVSKTEVDETIRKCGDDFPFFNTGVICWRQTDVVERLFDAWAEEWARFGQCDQFAFARALHRTGTKVQVLPPAYNHFIYDDRVSVPQGTRIAHFLGKEHAARRAGLWRPIACGPFESAFRDAVQHGLMAKNQYQRIGRLLYENRPCDVLVFGLGHDSALWAQCGGGYITFVEDNEVFAPFLPFAARLCSYKYSSRLGTWSSVPPVPQSIRRPWHYVIVDGPTGHSADTPGRLISITWASELATRAVFVHDYERDWERAIATKVLPPPDEVIAAQGRGDRVLARFDVKIKPSTAGLCASWP